MYPSCHSLVIDINAKCQGDKDFCLWNLLIKCPLAGEDHFGFPLLEAFSAYIRQSGTVYETMSMIEELVLLP